MLAKDEKPAAWHKHSKEHLTKMHYQEPLKPQERPRHVTEKGALQIAGESLRNCFSIVVPIKTTHTIRCRKTDKFCGKVIIKKFFCEVLFPNYAVFLVGAFSLKEKSPTITVGSFFSLQFHSEWSMFLTIFMSHEFLLAKYFYFFKSLRSIFTSSKNSTGPKGTPLEYFRLSETFFRKKFPQRVPLSNFLMILRQNGC